MKRVCVVGSANVDTVVRVHRHPNGGETVVATDRARHAGGKGLNQAVAAARLGANVALRARIGDDPDGAFLRAVLVTDSIDPSGVVAVDAQTGTADIAVDAAGENTIIVYPGANGTFSGLTGDDERAAAHAAVVLLQGEIPLTAVAAAAKAGHDGGATVVLTPAPVQPFPSSLLDLVDVLVPNEHEAVQLAGVDDPLGAACALSSASRTVVVTLGASGSAIARDGAITSRIAAIPTRPVDTTGAGDAFVGALGAMLALGLSIEQAAETASLAAALSVSRAGASESMPRLDEVNALLAARQP